MASNIFKCLADVSNFKITNQRGVKTCSMLLHVDVPQTGDGFFINAIVSSRNRKAWDAIGDLAEGVCLDVSGYLSANKRYVNEYRNKSGQAYCHWENVLVIEELTVLAGDD